MDPKEIVDAFCRLAASATGDTWYVQPIENGVELAFDFKSYSGGADEVRGALVMQAPDVGTLLDLMFIEFAESRDGGIGKDLGLLVAESGLGFLTGVSSKEEFALRILVASGRI